MRMSSLSLDWLRGNGESRSHSTAHTPRLSLDSTFEFDEAKYRPHLIEWLNRLFPHLKLPKDASEEELRGSLSDGTVLYSILNLMTPGLVDEGQVPRLEKVQKFVSTMEDMGFPVFEVSDLQQGSMSPVLYSLLALKDHFSTENRALGSPAKFGSPLRKKWRLLDAAYSEGISGARSELSYRAPSSPKAAEERRRLSLEMRFQRALRNPVLSEVSSTSMHPERHKFHEVFPLKQGRYSDLPPAKILEMLKTTSLDNAPTQSLLSVVNGILNESMDKKNGEIPHRVTCLLRKVVQEIERRISTQAEHIRNQSNLIKARDEKYLSRIKVLETLANGSQEENQISANQFQQIKVEKNKLEEAKKLGEQDMFRIAKEKEKCDLEIMELKKELELTKRTYEERYQQLGTQATETKVGLEEKLKEVEYLLEASWKKNQELEEFSQSEVQSWRKKEISYRNFLSLHSQSLQDLRMSSGSIKEEILDAQNIWQEDFNALGIKLKGLEAAAQHYHVVLAENRKLYNEVQDLKGNIRVYCRVRPFLPGQASKLSTIEYIGEDGELIVSNQSKQGKEGSRMFKFNKVFGPTASQEEVFLDTQPLIRSVLDGYNVCIFAYGQTGSGKTYTMTGPEGASPEEWGVNYRALNDLFQISGERRSTFLYEVGVQMVEIYNEQVRDLLSHDGSQKRLGIWNTSQPHGLAVPDASMHSVKSTQDVLELMQIGHANRAVGATALNVRSSRSHSVLTIHVRGMDLESGTVLRGSLHLVDLAGSERVDRSEVTGDRLKEAQHINKSLSALGDVIFALAQKSAHVPYRNSKLTQVLQSSLGGQAKTLMFVQLNPDADSFSETLSTLKFAERVNGVELGAARSSKEGKDVKELMEQVASLRDVIAKKDEEIERLQLLQDHRSTTLALRSEAPAVRSEIRRASGLKHASSQKSIPIDVTPYNSAPRGRASQPAERIASEVDNCSEGSDKHSDAGSQLSEEDLMDQKEILVQPKLSEAEIENEASTSSEFIVVPESVKQVESTNKSKVLNKRPRLPQKPGLVAPSRSAAKELPRISTVKDFSKLSTKEPSKVSSIKEPSKFSTSVRKTTEQVPLNSTKTAKRWH